jgi:hypothetical protein
MTLGSNRSPFQTFGRSTFEPSPGDPDLLPKPMVVRPSKERQPYGPDREAAGGTRAGVIKAAGPGPFPDDLFTATDIVGLPWTRRRGDEWTDATFRALVFDFIRAFFRDRPDGDLAGWDVEEKATGERGSVRFSADQHYLRFGITKRIRDTTARIEVSMNFPPLTRVSPEAETRLAILAVSLDAQLATIK